MKENCVKNRKKAGNSDRETEGEKKDGKRCKRRSEENGGRKENYANREKARKDKGKLGEKQTT